MAAAGSNMELKLVITADGKAAVTELNGVAAAEQRVGAAGEQAGTGVESLGTKLAATVGAAVAVERLIGTLATTLMEVQGQENALTAIAGSGDLAAAQMARLAALADRLGVAIGPLTAQWVSLSAATKGTALEGAATAAVFEAVVSAGAKLGLSTDKLGNGLLAVSQMASKGVISMEELRGQLGEAIPGAAQALARGLGLTTTQLNDLVESGRLTAEVALPALAKGLRETFGGDATTRIEGLSAASARLSNALRQLQVDLGDSGATTTLTWLTELATGLTSAAGVTGVLNAATVALGASLALGVGKLQQWVAESVKARAAEADRVTALQQANAEAVRSAETAQAVAAANAKAATAAKAEAGAWLELQTAQAGAAQAGQLAARAALETAEANAVAARATLAEASAEVKVQESRQLASVGTANQARVEAELAAARTRAETATLSVALAETELTASRERLATANTFAAKAQTDLTAANQAGLATIKQQTAAEIAAAESKAALTAALEKQQAEARKATNWTAALTTANGALGAAVALVMAYDLGAWMRETAAAAEEGSVGKSLADWFGLNGTRIDEDLRTLSDSYRLAREAEEDLAVQHEKAVKVLKAVKEATGQTYGGVAELNEAIKAGKVYQDQLTGAWVAGASAAANLAASTLGLLQQYDTTLKRTQDQRQAALDLAGAREDLAVRTARAAGDEAAALALQAQSEQAAITRTRERLSLANIALGAAKAELENAQAAAAAGGAVKAAEIEQLKTLVAQRQVAADQAQQAVAAQEQEARAARLTAQTYGDQSAQLTDLIAEQARLVQAIQSVGAASTAAQPLLAQLADVNVRIADAAKDAAKAQETLIAAQQRQAGIAAARAGVEQAELARLRDLATARGDLTRAQELSLQIAQSELTQAQAAVDAKRAEAAALSEKARLVEIAARATGGYTTEEQALTAAARDAATAAGVEADKLAVTARAKQDAVDATQRLAEQERVLGQEFAEAGVTGVTSLADVTTAISEAASSEALAALGQALQDAFAQGAISAAELTQALDDLEAKTEEVKAKGEASAQATAVSFTSYADLLSAYAGTAVQELGNYADEAAEIFGKLMFEQQPSGLYYDAIVSRLAAVAVEAAKGAQEVDRLTAALQDGSASAADLGSAQALVSQGIQGLDNERLDGLRSAIASAKQEMASFADSAQDGLRALQEEWASLNNDQAEVERLQYAERRLAIEQQIAQAQATGNSAALQSLSEQASLAQQIYQKKQQDLQAKAQEEQAQQAQQAQQAAAQQAQTQAAQQTAAQQAVTTPSTASQTTARTVHINLNLGGQTVGLDVAAGQEDDLIAALRRAQLVSA